MEEEDHYGPLGRGHIRTLALCNLTVCIQVIFLDVKLMQLCIDDIIHHSLHQLVLWVDSSSVIKFPFHACLIHLVHPFCRTFSSYQHQSLHLYYLPFLSASASHPIASLPCYTPLLINTASLNSHRCHLHRSNVHTRPSSVASAIFIMMDLSSASASTDMEGNFTREVGNGEVHGTKIPRTPDDYDRRNRTIPPEMLLPGLLSAEEDQMLNFHRCQEDIPHFLRSGPEKPYVFTHMAFSQARVKEILGLTLHKEYGRIREDFLRKRPDGKLQWEEDIRRNLRKNQLEARGRAYTLGPTMEEGCSLIRAAHGTVNNEADEAKYGWLNSRLALIASTIAREGIPTDLQQILDWKSLALGSIFYGHEDNTHFTTAQVNFTSVGQDLSKLGAAGGLHLDQNDDENYYTVLLPFSNIPPQYHHGRFVLPSQRNYWEPAPLSAFIFKGRNPHVGLPPAIRDQDRAQYTSTIEIPSLDPKIYGYARIMNVNYPRRLAIRQPRMYLATEQDGYQLELHGQASLGTKRNRQETFAAQDLIAKIALSYHEPDFPVPSATAVRDCRAWVEDGNVEFPRLDRLEFIREHHNKPNEGFDALEIENKALLTSTRFRTGHRVAHIHWSANPQDAPIYSKVKKDPKRNQNPVEDDDHGDDTVAPIDTKRRHKAKRPYSQGSLKYRLHSLRVNEDAWELLLKIFSNVGAWNGGRQSSPSTRDDMIHAHLWSDATPSITKDRLVPVRELAPSAGALFRALQDSAQPSSTENGGLTLANILSARLLYMGNSKLLNCWQDYESMDELLQSMEIYSQCTSDPAKGDNQYYDDYKMPRAGSQLQMTALEDYWSRGPQEWEILVKRSGEQLPSWTDLYMLSWKRCGKDIKGRNLAAIIASDMAILGFVQQPTKKCWPRIIRGSAEGGLQMLVPDFKGIQITEVAEFLFGNIRQELRQLGNEVDCGRILFVDALRSLKRFDELQSALDEDHSMGEVEAGSERQEGDKGGEEVPDMDEDEGMGNVENGDASEEEVEEIGEEDE